MLDEEQRKARNREKAHIWRERHPEKQKAVKKKYYSSPEHREKAKLQARAWRARNPGKRLVYLLRELYKLEWLEYVAMIGEQENHCIICGFTFDHSRKATRPHVDHCHTTGKIRGLLCMHCNTMLGYAKDNADILRSAARYLEERQ